MEITLLTRDPALGGNNWVLAGQEKNVRSLLWGKGRLKVKGTSTAEVEDSLDTYVAKRIDRNYVEQVRIKIYFPVEKIITFIIKNIPKINDFISRDLKDILKG